MGASRSGGGGEDEASFLDWEGRATLFDEDELEGDDEDDEEAPAPPRRSARPQAALDTDEVAPEPLDEDEAEEEDGDELDVVD